MVKLNRPIYGAFAVFLLLLAFWGCWFSLRGYLAFFKLSELVIFSWKVGVLVFFAPWVFYFSYLTMCCAIKNKYSKMNNKMANFLSTIAISGAVLSLLSSMYISQNLKDNGYKICPRKSWMAPNEYVRDLKMCP
ncbi:DUF1240 domain-containing protein [Serratia fonticola]|uniref:DUF1240 domain-containing protein n=1 Tax=Serratia fonticola TaxID=47917 RepID=UPI0021B796D7|nr:DUF1240 domain-containing protein [Serratia fonticola]MDQ7207815.1 DUF1240 domain-containing protein [Serratia fonticola]HBE9078053.1 DUF1240 domain-containing protein [Serratia fonticola]HBE9088580.1 DUF1240 domain-containing protein [Serratia fonticola]HBE9150778.1 DUF1240 domain-containing protein [Serratia fonticola]